MGIVILRHSSSTAQAWRGEKRHVTRDTTLAAAGGSVAQLLYLDSRLLCSQNLQSQEIWRKANFLIGTEQLRGPTSPI